MRTHAKAALIGGALSLIATMVDAQENAPNPAPAASDQEGVIVNPPDNVFIVSPPIGRSWMGAPIVDVSISRGIRTDDLDLRTDDGVRQLRGRVFAAAGALCRWMNAMYPIDHNRNSGPWLQASACYRDAVRNAMKQADSAIDAARGYGGR